MKQLPMSKNGGADLHPDLVMPVEAEGFENDIFSTGFQVALCLAWFLIEESRQDHSRGGMAGWLSTFLTERQTTPRGGTCPAQACPCCLACLIRE